MSRHEIRAEVTGAVWQIVAAVGDHLSPGDDVMVLESMKMEIPVVAEDGGTVVEISVVEGESVTEGRIVAVLEDN